MLVNINSNVLVILVTEHLIFLIPLEHSLIVGNALDDELRFILIFKVLDGDNSIEFNGIMDNFAFF